MIYALTSPLTHRPPCVKRWLVKAPCRLSFLYLCEVWFCRSVLFRGCMSRVRRLLRSESNRSGTLPHAWLQFSSPSSLRFHTEVFAATGVEGVSPLQGHDKLFCKVAAPTHSPHSQYGRHALVSGPNLHSGSAASFIPAHPGKTEFIRVGVLLSCTMVTLMAPDFQCCGLCHVYTFL